MEEVKGVEREQRHHAVEESVKYLKSAVAELRYFVDSLTGQMPPPVEEAEQQETKYYTDVMHPLPTILSETADEMQGLLKRLREIVL